ncbi:hypothetical protein EYF80_063689 [Liparis tanakae]|uniref:Uncharacterized protein n=1 Tax=Liparis tanakae TaxID=230148 RepID=A0A4Z2ECB1_9TELE|nr:hypothetical protein EYF80_063689 [Liparis tanakae]
MSTHKKKLQWPYEQQQRNGTSAKQPVFRVPVQTGSSTCSREAINGGGLAPDSRACSYPSISRASKVRSDRTAMHGLFHF